MSEPVPLHVEIGEADEAVRYVLRARAPDALHGALPFPLPLQIGETARGGGLSCHCLGPDEWLVVAADQAALGALIDAAAGVPVSLVDVSDRDCGLTVRGPGAVEALCAGCPRDPAAIPVGEAVRTVFDRVGIILERTGPDAFALLVPRSYAPHVRWLLDRVEEELAAGL